MDWEIHYEFVTLAQDGVGVPSSNSAISKPPGGKIMNCDRDLISDMAGGSYSTMQEYAISTPRNLFMYGRGGQENITCRFVFN